MKIDKKGLIYCPNSESEWMVDTFMTPHATLISEKRIRIWGGCRDKTGVSRIIHLDVDADNPTHVLNVSTKPDLDIGNPGCFDDNGVILGDVIEGDNNTFLMYYVGFQHVQKAKFYAFSGVACSTDGGETFYRKSEVPIMDRTNTGRYGRCIHTVLHENGLYKCYYAVINDWKIINNVPYPIYNIWYTTSIDGIHFSNVDECLCVDMNDEEYRIGRPKVYHLNGRYIMLYTRDFIEKDYVIGIAESEDGIRWMRNDEKFTIPKSANGWDSEMACYPVLLPYRDKIYVFYNGNGMGKTGIGYGILENYNE